MESSASLLVTIKSSWPLATDPANKRRELKIQLWTRKCNEADERRCTGTRTWDGLVRGRLPKPIMQS